MNDEYIWLDQTTGKWTKKCRQCGRIKSYVSRTTVNNLGPLCAICSHAGGSKSICQTKFENNAEIIHSWKQLPDNVWRDANVSGNQWFKKCKHCGETDSYVNKQSALTLGEICVRCKVSEGITHDFQHKRYVRICPNCKGEIYHLYEGDDYWKGKGRAVIAKRKNQSCHSCASLESTSRPEVKDNMQRPNKPVPSWAKWNNEKKVYEVTCPICNGVREKKVIERKRSPSDSSKKRIQDGCCQKCQNHPDNRIQTPEWIEKRFKKRYVSKKYTFPSGKTINVQGYEPAGLDYLQQQMGILEEDITTSTREGMPSFKYFFNGKERWYFPDAYVKSKRIVVEVKSTWTHKDQIVQNKLKMEVVFNEGYNILYLVFDHPPKIPVEKLEMNH